MKVHILDHSNDMGQLKQPLTGFLQGTRDSELGGGFGDCQSGGKRGSWVRLKEEIPKKSGKSFGFQYESVSALSALDHPGIIPHHTINACMISIPLQLVESGDGKHRLGMRR